MLPTLHPFIKWAGGKRRLIPSLQKLVPDKYNTYYEPFIGGGSLFLALQPEKAVIGDTNAQLINVWKQIAADPENLIQAVTVLDAVPADPARYHDLRAAYNAGIHTIFDLEQASLFIWLNKHCFNGLYRVNRQGFFNVPYNGKETGPSIDPNNIRAISAWLQEHDISIFHGDFRKTCENAGKDDFVYLDPPYLPMGETRDFTAYVPGGFCPEDHAAVADFFKELHTRDAYVMASNNDTHEAHRLYDFPWAKAEHIGTLSRSIKASGETLHAKETIFRNF